MSTRAIGLVSVAGLLVVAVARECYAESVEGSRQVPQTAESDAPKKRRTVDKLKLAYFPNYSAKLLMPVQFQKKDFNGQVTAIGADLPHGIYMFLSMSGPDNEDMTVAQIKPLIKAVVEGMKAEVSTETPIKLKDYHGLEMLGKVKVEADVEAVARGYVAGKKLYIVSAMGTKVWMQSSAVSRFFDSLEIAP